MSVRPAAVAGYFYPGEVDVLLAEVENLLSDAATRTQGKQADQTPAMLVVPHAGYIYSGAIAATAFQRLEGMQDSFDRTVVIGPSHRFAFRGIGLPSVNSFATPLGRLSIDREARALLLEQKLAAIVDEAHTLEHSLEVQLPFLQVLLPDLPIVPLVVGDASPADVARCLLALREERTLFVVSTDLSHYLPYARAQQVDRSTCDQILALNNGIHTQQACGARPLNGALLMAKRTGMTVELLDLRNSGDTAGDPSRVVGYGSFVFGH